MLADSVPALAPVIGHKANKKHFSHKEDVAMPSSLDQRKVDVQVHEQADGHQRVVSKVTHHHFNPERHMGMHKEMEDMTSNSEVQVHQNVVTR